MKVKAILLSAGLGTRLKPHTDYLPKCLMPIKGIPLLEIWIRTLSQIGVDEILVNLHYKAEEVIEFLNRDVFKNKIKTVFEPKLLGTAGTVRANFNFIKNNTILLVHADNLCICDLSKFIEFHTFFRPRETVMTMMTFKTDSPETCGILELDSQNRVIGFHEKVKNPPGNLANAAIYLIEKEVVQFIYDKNIYDFSNNVIPKFLGKIATWENLGIMRDIGNPTQLKKAQEVKIPLFPIQDAWSEKYNTHPIHQLV
jgi:mannose-1-phosphate guanylyltransferase